MSGCRAPWSITIPFTNLSNVDSNNSLIKFVKMTDFQLFQLNSYIVDSHCVHVSLVHHLHDFHHVQINWFITLSDGQYCINNFLWYSKMYLSANLEADKLSCMNIQRNINVIWLNKYACVLFVISKYIHQIKKHNFVALHCFEI